MTLLRPFKAATLAASALALCAAAPSGLGQAQVDDSAFALGTLTRADGALAANLWQGGEAEAVDALLSALPRAYAEPAYFDLARRVLLSPGQGPDGADNALAGTKLLAAAELGFYQEAGDLAALAPGLSGLPALAKVDALSSLLDGDVPGACARGAGLTRGRTDPFFLKLRFLCYLDTGEDQAADLTLSLLTDQGILSDGDARIFAALASGSKVDGSVSPQDAFQLAGLRRLGVEVSAEAVGELPGSVLAALARDPDADASLRADALERALSLRLIGAEEGMKLAGEAAASSLAAEVVGVASQPRGGAEEAVAIARSLSQADDWTGFRARTTLYAPRLVRLNADMRAADAAPMLALAASAAGDEAAARRWLDLARSADVSGTEAVEQLFGAVFGDGAQAGVTLEDTIAATDAELSTVVQGALSAAASRAEGPAILAALTALGTQVEEDDAEAELIRAMLVGDMLSRAGQIEPLARRRALDAEGPQVLDALKGGKIELRPLAPPAPAPAL